MSSHPSIYPLLPYPVLKPWGGGHLNALTQKLNGENVGEYVIFSNLPQFPVQVRTPKGNFPLADFWPRVFSNEELPFMIKILSTAEPLSLQNHPSDDDVKELGLPGKGKFECWTVLDAADDASAYLGIKEGFWPSTLYALDKEENPLRFFNNYALKKGDVVRLDPGLIHTTTGRLLFYEVQQVSDHTFRIYDFGRGRALHLKEAVHCVRDQKPSITSWTSALETPYFSVAYHACNKSLTLTRRGEKISVFTWLGRDAELTTAEGKLYLRWGDSFLAAGAKKTALQIKVGIRVNPTLEKLPLLDMLFEAYV
ncbi:MAG TPA: class I mannose-6-phosphate isomerase [Turneriella sp.]|nr:class I mannose-6-phosphate isomerase [Turneriella sp.]